MRYRFSWSLQPFAKLRQFCIKSTDCCQVQTSVLSYFLTLTECCYLPNIFPFIRCVAAYSSSFFYFHTHQSFPSYLQLYSSLYNLLMEFSRKSFFISPNTPLTYHLIGDLQALDMYNHPCKISFLCAQMSE